MTALFSADDLSHALGGTMTRPFHATGVSIDTRTLQPGDVFVALQTESGDGHGHVAAALAAGAAGALVHRQHDLPDDAPLVVVGDTLAGLTALGGFARARFTGAVAAITGSVGKTTTKEMLRAILSESGRTHAAVASYNNHWGVPLTLARMPPDFDYAVIEIGMNHPGEIAPLAVLRRPRRGGDHRGGGSAYRPSGQPRGDRGRKGERGAGRAAGRVRGAAGPLAVARPAARGLRRARDTNVRRRTAWRCRGRCRGQHGVRHDRRGGAAFPAGCAGAAQW